MFGNEYYVVPDTLPLQQVWIKKGSKPGNHYYGASQIYDVIGEQVTLYPGDEIHNLVGGMFLVREDGTEVYEVLHKSPAELNQHFCKDYTPRSWYYERITKSLVSIPANQRIVIDYRRA